MAGFLVYHQIPSRLGILEFVLGRQLTSVCCNHAMQDGMEREITASTVRQGACLLLRGQCKSQSMYCARSSRNLTDDGRFISFSSSASSHHSRWLSSVFLRNLVLGLL